MRLLRGSCLLCAALAASCGFSSSSTSLLDDIPGLDTSALVQTYTGVLQEAGGTQPVYVNLAQTVTVTQAGVAQLEFSSSAFPSFTAVVLSTGSAAVNLDLADISGGTGVEVKEIGFTKDQSGVWILFLQTATVADGGKTGRVVQFASYDPMNAPPRTATLAVDYLDKIFALAASLVDGGS